MLWGNPPVSLCSTAPLVAVSYTHLDVYKRQIFNFVYNTLQLTTLDPANDVGLAQMVMGSQTHGVTPTALAAAFQIFYEDVYKRQQMS